MTTRSMGIFLGFGPEDPSVAVQACQRWHPGQRQRRHLHGEGGRHLPRRRGARARGGRGAVQRAQGVRSQGVQNHAQRVQNQGQVHQGEFVGSFFNF